VEVTFGAEVIDQNGKVLGTVDHLARDTWTGEIRKFVVRRENGALFLVPDDVSDIMDGTLKLKKTLEELSQR